MRNTADIVIGFGTLCVSVLVILFGVTVILLGALGHGCGRLRGAGCGYLLHALGRAHHGR
jgi:hypothetical protein